MDDVSDLPPEVINELSRPFHRQMADAFRVIGLKPVYRGYPGKFRYVGTRWIPRAALGTDIGGGRG